MSPLARVLTIFRREIMAYWNSAIAVIFIICFVVLNGGLFMTQFFLIQLADMRPFFTFLPLSLAVFLPALTMRQWAEDKKGNTLELLLTFPMPAHEIVLGKFLAGFVFYLAALLATLPVPLMLAVLGRPDFGPIAGGYAGAVLMGAFFLSAGIFISGLCRDQIVALILGLMACFGLHLLGTQFVAASLDGWVPGLGSFLEHFVGSAGHFESFAKGVIDAGDALYFVLGAAIFLTLNGFWFEGRMRPGSKKFFTAAVLLSAGIFISSSWLFGNLTLGRFDLTEGRIYTVSPAAKKILSALRAPVTVKFYVSPQDKMPTGMKTLEQDVAAKLEELRLAAKGKLQFKIFHMEAANVTEAADEASEKSLEAQIGKKGIYPFQLQAVESDEVAVRLVYSAMSLAYKEKPEEVIPRVMPESLDELEFLLVSKIYRMTLPESPKIALVAPYEEQALDPQMAALMAQLGGRPPETYRDDAYELLGLALNYEGYEVARVRLSQAEPIPEGTKTLAVVEPEALNERQLYEINRFLIKGGSLFMAVQSYVCDYQTSGMTLRITPMRRNPGVNGLLSHWGFEVEDNILVDEQHEVINMSGDPSLGPFQMPVPVKVPIQVLLTQEGMNPDVSITSRLSPIFYLWGTALRTDPEKWKAQGLKVETLLSSSAHSWTVPMPEGVLEPSTFEIGPASRKGPLPLAVMAEGQFNDAYFGKEAPEWPKDPSEEAAAALEKPAPLSITPAPGKLILVGASSFLQKNFFQGGGHLAFFLNSIDVLSLGEELVTIRSKQVIDRSIGRISRPAKIAWRLFVTVFVPLLLAAAGLLRAFLQNRAKERYLKSLNRV